MVMVILKKGLVPFLITVLCSLYPASMTGHSGMIKLLNPETHGNGYFSLNLSTLLGAGSKDGDIVLSTATKDYFQSTNHLSLNVSLGNYIDLGAKASFAVDRMKDEEGKSYTLNRINIFEPGIRVSFKRTGVFRAGMYLYGQVPVIKRQEDITHFSDFSQTAIPADTIRYYNHRKFSDEFLFNPNASFGGKLMTSVGNDYFRVILNGGYLWRTAQESDTVNFSPSKNIDILPDVWTFGAGMDIFLHEKARLFVEWDGEYFTEKKTSVITQSSDPDAPDRDIIVSGDIFPQRLGGGFRFFANENFSATLGSFFALNSDAPKWQIYAGLTFSGNMVTPNPDSDGDGVCDPWVSESGLLSRYRDICTGVDLCPDTPLGVPVDKHGCPVPDSDGDGVCDPWVSEMGMQSDFAHICTGVDLCPDTPRGVPVDEHGCPIPDSDGDGVCDPWVSEMGMQSDFAHICTGVDLCPDTPRGVPVDKDGCPNPDSDGDGVCDPWVSEHGLSEMYADICTGVDRCPDTPRGITVDEHGCPNPDTDGDGVCDPWVMDMGLSERYAHICVGSDKCPDTPPGDEVDEFGCTITRIIMEKDQTIVLDNIYFRVGSAELEPTSYQTLNSLRQIFIDNPGIVVQIEGHTDSTGSDQLNLRLSKERAETVADYIVNVLGVSRHQVSSVGYGPTRPVATNQTSLGRAQNRRIEFRVISSGR